VRRTANELSRQRFLYDRKGRGRRGRADNNDRADHARPLVVEARAAVTQPKNGRV